MNPPESLRISVALAAYNGERYIAEQLASIAAQTLQPAELVVTDDSTTDLTRNVVLSFASGASFPVHYHRNTERLGFRDNFLKAALLCRSDYVAYSDQDDVWLPTKLERCANALSAEHTVLAIHGAHITDESLRVVSTLKQGFDTDAVKRPLSLQPLPGIGFGFTMVFERRLLTLVPQHLRPECPAERASVGEVDTPKRATAHDLWTYLLASVFGNTAQISEPLALYRQHQTNAYGSARLPKTYHLVKYLQVPLDQYERRRRFAKGCAFALRTAAVQLVDQDRDNAIRGADFYEELAQLLQIRIDLYTSRSIRRRLHSYRRLRDMGAYGSALGRSARARDLVNGVAHLRVLSQ